MATVIWTNGAGDGDYSNSANWSTGTVPTTSDNVYFTSDYNSDVTTGLNQSGTTINDFIVDGYTGKLGSKTTYLQIDPAGEVRFNGTGLSYVDLGNANVDITVDSTASASGGSAGLYLVDTNLNTLSVNNGVVGLAYLAGETSTVGTVKLTSGTVLFGSSVTATTISMYGGTVRTESSITTLNIYDGTFTSSGSAAITTINGDGGLINHDASGTITTCNLRGVTLELTNTLVSKTITTLNPSDGGTLTYDPTYVTITNRGAVTKPTTESWNNAF